MSNYQVIVGNIGLVHESNNLITARGAYGEYKRQSQSNYGRAAGEAVTLFKDGEPHVEYNPPGEQP
jgi:hypothetical protein